MSAAAAPVGILLAAGSSRRFGADKRWHRLVDGTPMALRSAAALREACSCVVVVVRPADDELARACEELGYAVLRNGNPAAGIGDSLALAVRATRDAGGWLIALADMPFIAPATYRLVLDALAHGASAARPEFRNQVGHPVGFSASWGERLAALSGDRGARALIEAAGGGCVLVEVGDAGVVRDIDRPSDLAGLPIRRRGVPARDPTSLSKVADGEESGSTL